MAMAARMSSCNDGAQSDVQAHRAAPLPERMQQMTHKQQAEASMAAAEQQRELVLIQVSWICGCVDETVILSCISKPFDH